MQNKVNGSKFRTPVDLMEPPMDKVLNNRRFLVVTPHVVIGEDLRETLQASADTEVEVDVFASLESAWELPYEVAFFGYPLADVLADERVLVMRKAGCQIVVLNGHIPQPDVVPAKIRVLSQPFTSEDVDVLMRDLVVR